MYTHARSLSHDHNVVRAARTTVYSALYGPPALKRRAAPRHHAAPLLVAGLSARLLDRISPVRESPSFPFSLFTHYRDWNEALYAQPRRRDIK